MNYSVEYKVALILLSEGGQEDKIVSFLSRVSYKHTYMYVV